MDTDGGPDSFNEQQVDNAIRAIREKKPLPEIDFSIHVMEDGTQVNTMERVCKGKGCPRHHPSSVCLSSPRRHTQFKEEVELTVVALCDL
jgi:hypothetical protein